MARPRVFIGAGSAPERPNGWNAAELHEHVRGRAEATARLLIGVAILRSSKVLPDSAVVSVTAAKWQDWKGTAKQPRAHRFPCNPQINGRDLPDLAPSDRVRDFLEDALAVTDPLFLHVNYTDQLFEDRGGIEAARKGLQVVAHHQRSGAPVSHHVAWSAWDDIVRPGYVGAWQRTAESVLGRINDESTKQFLARVKGYKPSAPTHDLETAVEVAFEAKRFTEQLSTPSLLTVPGFARTVGRLGFAFSTPGGLGSERT